MTGYDDDQETVRALLENVDGIRARMRPDDVRRLDALTLLLATPGNEQNRARILARIRELLAENLVSDADAPGARRFKYGSAVPPDAGLERTLELLLRSSGGAQQPQPGAAGSSSSADPWQVAVARLLDTPSVDAAQLAAGLRDPGQRNLVRLRRGDGTVQLPSFQFDEAGRPLALVLTINEILDADHDPWGVADWWLGDHRWLPFSPAACLGRIEDERLLEAARYVVQGEWS